MITTIQRMSLHDGYGIRSTLFLKGCNFRCAWCHNPETWSLKPQLQYIKGKCLKCGHCVEMCPLSAITLDGGKISINREVCDKCGLCSEECLGQALMVVGEEIGVDEVVTRLLIDKPYFDASNGGVTVSGGEPFLQFEFMRDVVKKCHEMGIHTAIETNLSCSQEQIREVAPYIDLWMVDLKCADVDLHRQFTKASNEATISNIKYLATLTSEIIVRTPIIPQFNDTMEQVEAMCEILLPLNISKYELLPYHQWGYDKFEQVAMECSIPFSAKLDMDKMQQFVDYVAARFEK